VTEPKATTGFGLYESLRYFLPGVLLVFLFAYVALPDYAESYTVAEKLVAGVLVGFIVHSFGMYKCMRGATRTRKEFHQKVKELLAGVSGVYVRWDTALLTITTEERQHCRKYFALGAFKLDMAFVLAIFLVYYAVNAFRSMVRANALSASPLGAMFLMSAAIWIVTDDGLNDLRRAFNIALMALISLREKPDLTETLELIARNQAQLIAGERRFLHPVETLWAAVIWLPRWLLESIRLTQDQG